MNTAWHSPLWRHPALALRKVGQRLGRRPAFQWKAPPGVIAQSPAELAPMLRAWAQQCLLRSEPYDSGHLFGHDFTRQEMLELCRTGPRPVDDLRGDIKLIWEFSRGYALVLNAIRVRPEDSDAAAVSIAREIRDWLDYNREPDGVNWTCAMEIAIRAVNWLCCDALLEGRLRQKIGAAEWDTSLWNHGCAIWARLEARLVCSNHYIADLLGLLYIGSAFRADAVGRYWMDFALAEMPRALASQSYADGGLYEASLPYHALVTEMALLFYMAAGHALDDRMQARLGSMCQVLADAQAVDGDVFQVGDNDGGRVIPLDFLTQRNGRAVVLLQLAALVLRREFIPQQRALYPQSGWWFARHNGFTVMLEFGGVGMAGQGGHAHNDALALCVNWRGRKILVDPGSYCYTSNPSVRDSFRSTLAHNTLLVDGREQLPLPSDTFRLPGPAVRQPSGDDPVQADQCTASFDWRRAGIEVLHRRTVSVTARGVHVEDKVEGAGLHTLTWVFHFAPDLPVLRQPDGFLLGDDLSGRLRLFWPEASAVFKTAEGWYSPFYGVRFVDVIWQVEVKVSLPHSLVWQLQPVE